MEGDSSDILGGPTFPHARDSHSGAWSGLSFGLKSTFVIAALLSFYVICIRIWETFLVWREKSYKLTSHHRSMRRRHGIPDNDHRPFNVAYAAVVRARQENEASARRAKLHDLVQDQQNAPPNQNNIRQRQGNQHNSESTQTNSIPGRYQSADVYSSTYANAINTNYSQPSFATHDRAEDRYKPIPTVRITEPNVDPRSGRSGPSRRQIRKYITISDDGRNHGPDGDDSYSLDAKKGDQGEEFIEGEEEWDERQQPLQRGSKRVLGDEDNFDDDYASTRMRDKRARKFSLEKVPQYEIEEDMEVEEYEDDVAELRPSSVRGKKRDRAEAGSTFGGDDDDSSHEDGSKAHRRHRKRRTYAKRKSDASGSERGQKRDRDLEEGDSDMDEDDGMTLKVSRKKRGKRSAPTSAPSELDDASDISMASQPSRKSAGRRIGEEWESNGVKYKIGPNGQRLRQALVKKARQKFNMPEDSQHPDRQANLQVCIETWLTEEEYRQAKDQLLLAWQDSDKLSAEPETPTRESEEPAPVAGKDLLWKATSGAPTPGSSTPRQITPPPGTPQSKAKGDGLSQSVANAVGLRINPFQKPATSSKRISSAARVSSAFNGAPSSPVSSISSLTDSTNGIQRHKSFSKWEKQDLEAQAMMKMREANRKKEELAQKLKEEKEKAEKEKAEKLKKEQEVAAAPKIIPTITLTTPDEPKPVEAAVKTAGFSFGPPATQAPKKDAAPIGQSHFGVIPGAQPQPQKPTDKPATPSFSFGPPTTSTNPPNFSLSNAPPLGGGLPAKPVENPFAKKQEEQQVKPPTLSFGTPAPASTPASNPTPLTFPSVAPSTSNAFSFGPPPSQSQAEKKPEAPGSTSGNSIFSRIAPAGATQPSSQPPQASSAFFAKPVTTETPKTSFGNFGAPQNTTTPPAAAAPTSGPKFNFGFNKPTAPASVPVPATTAPASSSLSGALGTGASTSPFSFNKPGETSNASTTPTPAVGGATSTPKFSFGPASTTPSAPASSAPNPFGVKTPTTTPAANTSVFGASNPFSSTTSTGASSTTPAGNASTAFGAANPFGSKTSTTTPSTTPAGTPSAFTGFGNNTSSTSAFASTTPTASPFGSSGAFGAGSTASPSPFGAPATTKPEEPKAAFSFTTPTTTSSTPVTAKPVFSFAPSSTTPAPTTAASFGFGDGAKTSTTPAGGSIFGKTSSGPSAFGFGAPATNAGTTNSFSFGKAPTTTGQQQQ
ncbi:hypothetical protein H0H81_005864 [Sphagnurus paluster]|uniref:Uncharacterized protein n=1 Tax=Sphagnurus paluster TaxID=117069 RepID=A0A9P7FYJ0_9AGAR|nr:hypothetical protein H0H81_005864 [Sphagnurus paluster]